MDANLIKHPFIQKKKIEFKLGKKRFQCNQCGEFHTIPNDNGPIRACVEKVMKNVPPASLEQLPFHQWLLAEVERYTKFERARYFDSAIASLWRIITSIIQKYGQPHYAPYVSLLSDLMDNASILSLDKQELHDILSENSNKDAKAEMDNFFSQFPFSELEAWINHNLSGKLFEDNPSEHDWNLVITPNRGGFRKFRSFQGEGATYVEYDHELLGSRFDTEVKISPIGFEYRNKITCVHMLIPFDYKQPIKKSLHP